MTSKFDALYESVMADCDAVLIYDRYPSLDVFNFDDKMQYNEGVVGQFTLEMLTKAFDNLIEGMHWPKDKADLVKDYIKKVFSSKWTKIILKIIAKAASLTAATIYMLSVIFDLEFLTFLMQMGTAMAAAGGLAVAFIEGLAAVVKWINEKADKVVEANSPAVKHLKDNPEVKKTIEETQKVAKNTAKETVESLKNKSPENKDLKQGAPYNSISAV